MFPSNVTSASGDTGVLPLLRLHCICHSIVLGLEAYKCLAMLQILLHAGALDQSRRRGQRGALHPKGQASLIP